VLAVAGFGPRPLRGVFWRCAVAMVGFVVTVCNIPSAALAEGWRPSEPLTVTIPFGPGGGNDILARTLIRILEQYRL